MRDKGWDFQIIAPFFPSSFILILTPLQKIILETMLCDTDNESLLVEDHLHPILFLKGSAEDCPGP